ncbi:MAG: pyruvate ferredoxin oxidoreductase [Anaerolineae bacterium]|nr:pyruvate ferredoxin oxidoreductase [Anaerolineae bacterium]MDW8102785.1 pyruvate ferredoxin oxidoreductase [Anaerolineae bacterium]
MAAKQILKALDGAKAVAEAMRQIEPDVVAAYPITPQTEIVQTFSQFVADGLVNTEFIPAESEHAAMSACIGAAAAGARVMTATAANGLALMWETLYIAASMRLPIVMSVVNRALSAPLNIHCDHSDSMGARDSGWIHIFSENPQEAYDNTIQAVRIAEHPDVLLPVMSMQDGFITGHGLERVEVLEDRAVKEFVGEYKPLYSLLDIDEPKTFGAWAFYDYYFEFKRQQTEALSKVPQVVKEVGREYGELSGRYYDLFSAYELDDAEVAIVVLASTAGTTRTVVRKLRREGVKVGLLKPRLYRPFPGKELVEALRHVKVIGVMDRSVAFGSIEGCGPLFLDLCASFYTYGNGKGPQIVDYIFGLGGRDILPDQIEGVIRELLRIAETGEVPQRVGYVGLRE